MKFLSPQHFTSSTPFVLKAIIELPCLPLEPAGLQILSYILGLYDIGIFPQAELLLETLPCLLLLGTTCFVSLSTFLSSMTLSILLLVLGLGLGLGLVFLVLSGTI